MKTLAVLTTVHNRREKTLAALRALYAQLPQEEVQTEIYLTDDGSTDGTAETIAAEFGAIHILPGDGTLYWNGGMRRAWDAAAAKDYDYYLWLNDDTLLFPDALAGLLAESHVWQDRAIVCGATHSAAGGEITYGGRCAGRLIPPAGETVACDTFNGNVVLVPRAVFHRLGNLDAGFTHALGDFDYGLRATRAKIPIRQAGRWAGVCERHATLPKWCDPALPLRERYKWFRTPLGGHPTEQFRFERRHFGLLSACFHFMTIHLRLLLPRIWKRRT